MPVLRKFRRYHRGQSADVTRRGELAGIKKPIGIYKMGCPQSQFLSRRVHLLDKVDDRAIRRLGKHIGHVIGRVDKKRLQCQIDGYRTTSADADLAWLLRGSQWRHQDFLIKKQAARFYFLENNIGGHQLCQRGGIPGFTGAVMGNNLSR